MASIAIQRGHCFRTRGATGTSGHRGTEQQYADRLAKACAKMMRDRGHTVYVLTADEAVPKTDVFVAFHQDGSISSSAHGASVGYQTARSKAYATTWKILYEQAGWPQKSGFRPDNYTSALRNYYGFRRASSDAEVIFEHGFATNQRDENWMWDHLETTARVHADTLDSFVGAVPPPGDDDLTPEQDRMLKEIYKREVEGFPEYGMHPNIEATNLTLREVRGVGGDNTLRHFIQDQDRRTRELTDEGFDELWRQIEALAEAETGPINVTPADARAIAQAVVELLRKNPLAPID